MPTVIPSINILTNIGAVDTSSASSGVSMYSLHLETTVTNAGSLIYFEYFISDSSDALVPVGKGFLPLESTVSCKGIANELTIGIPSITETGEYYVKVRAYVGQTTIHGPDIRVSEWTNHAKMYSPPSQPSNPRAFIVPGEQSGYVYDDLLYVQIEYIPNEYDLSQNTFIVSYSYTDSNGNNQWIVSAPLQGTKYGNIIALDPITLDTDVSYGALIYVAVNAVNNYTDDSNNYFTVSEISSTVVAQMASPGAPTLNPINIPNDYLVYSTPSLQEVVLTWAAPYVSAIPNFAIDHYVVNVYVGGSIIYTTNVGTDLTYTYIIPSTYTDASASSSTQFSFTISGVTATGGSDISGPQTVQTFTYATEPQNLSVSWVNEGSTNGVDMMITFKNPLIIGQGTEPYLMIKVYDASGVEIVITGGGIVEYVPDNVEYVIFLANVPTSDTGEVTVCMMTTDTNRTTSDEQYKERQGAIASTQYELSELPVIMNVTRGNSVLTFDVITHTALVAKCLFVSLSGGTFVSEYFFTTTTNDDGPTEYEDASGNKYTVDLTTNVITHDLEYKFTFENTWLSDAGITGIDSFAIEVSNAAGISSRHVGPVEE